MNNDLRIALRPKAVAAVLQVRSDLLETIQLSIDDHADSSSLIRDRHLETRQINDAKPGLCHSHLPPVRNPVACTVGTATGETATRRKKIVLIDRFISRKNRDYAAHFGSVRKNRFVPVTREGHEYTLTLCRVKGLFTSNPFNRGNHLNLTVRVESSAVTRGVPSFQIVLKPAPH